MKVIDYFESDRKEHWLGEINRSEWAAARFLHEMLSKQTFSEFAGGRSKVLLLTEGDELISFCTYAEKDDIPCTDLAPWVGFVYTFPEHRGHHYAGLLMDEAERLAEKDGFSAFYISTTHVGLYEKYGCVFKTEMKDMNGEMSRVYEKQIRKVLETERLILRPWEESDAEDMYRYASDPDVGPIAGWPPHKSVEESLDVIKNVLGGKEAYAVCLKDDGRAIGTIELKLNGHTDMTDRDDECEMGYWLGKPFWGRGIMPEAVKEMLRHAFEDCGMQKVWIGYYEGNTKSKRVQEKCGFRCQWRSENVDVPLMHEKRTGHVSSLTRDQWEWYRLYEAARAVLAPRRISDYVTAGEVSAAVLSASGKIYTGVCVDTCSTLGICAERNAVFNMLTNGEQTIAKVLCIPPVKGRGAPCGACRELMVQLMPDSYKDIEIMLDYESDRVMTLGELTPEWWIGDQG